jgi:dolichol-phosphate mannosyltransferase
VTQFQLAAPAFAASVIVPTYNERLRLTELVTTTLEAWARAGFDGEIVIVDDNSPDGTGDLADRLAEGRPVQVVHRAGKLGLGTAVIEGFAAARSAIVGVMDADLSHPPGLLPHLLSVLHAHRADLVIGSRYVPGGGTRHWPVSRLLMSKVACLLARPLTPVRDATSGVFLIRRGLAREVRISAGGFKICLELLIRGQPGLVAEVPYVFVGRTEGQSKMNTWEALGYLRQLWDLHAFQRLTGAKRPRYVRLPPVEAAPAQGPSGAAG